MVKNSYDFFIKNCNFKHIALEVPFLSRCIDMVLVNKNNIIFTIEFKLHDIKQAVKQAMDHSLGSDYAFISIPEKKNINMDFLKNKNIGLFIYNPSFTNKVRTVYYPNTDKNKVDLFNKMLLQNTMNILNICS